MLRALFWMTPNFTTYVILTDLWWRIIMERNGSFVSGYLCEILPSAKEPKGDLQVTQNSSEARTNNAFSRKGIGTSLGECLLNCSRKQMINFTYPVSWSNSRQMIRCVSKSVVNKLLLNCQIVNISGFAIYMSSLWHSLCFLLQILHKCENDS